MHSIENCKALLREGLRLAFASADVVEEGDGTPASGSLAIYVDTAVRFEAVGQDVLVTDGGRTKVPRVDALLRIHLLEYGGEESAAELEAIAVWLTRQRFDAAFASLWGEDSGFQRPEWMRTEVADMIVGEHLSGETAWTSEIIVRFAGLALGTVNGEAPSETGSPLRRIVLTTPEGEITISP